MDQVLKLKTLLAQDKELRSRMSQEKAQPADVDISKVNAKKSRKKKVTLQPIVIVILVSPDNKMVTTNPLVHQPVHQPVFSEKSYCPTMDVFFIKIVSWTSTSSQSLAWPTVLRYVAASFAKPFTLE